MPYLPERPFSHDSKAGVALPKRVLHPRWCAIHTATSRAE